MGISTHIANQEKAIWKGISAATKAGGDQERMVHSFEVLRTAIEGVEVAVPTAIDMLGAGFFSAFADAGDQWDYHLDRARSALTIAAPMMSGLETTFSLVLEEFIVLRQRNVEAARHFGFALCRMHPMTVELAKQAA